MRPKAVRWGGKEKERDDESAGAARAVSRVGAQDRARDREELWLAVLLFTCGAIPWLGYLLEGRWDQRELGLRLLLMLLPARSLGRAGAALLRPGYQGSAVRRFITEELMDIAYLALTAAFFALSWGFIKLCERV